MVAAEMNGDLSLTVYESVKVKLRTSAPFIELPVTPVTSVQRVKLGDSVLEPTEYEVHCFGIQKADGWWPAHCTITIDYMTGWATGQEPNEIKQALILTDKYLATDPESGITEVRMGDQTVKRVAPDARIPNVASSLVRKWTKP